MAGIFQKVVAKMRQEEKAKAKDDSSITKKSKPIVKPKPKAEDDFEIQELLAWAKNNEPDEGWITNNKIKEIRLRKRYFEKNIDKKMSWPDYLSSKEKKGIIKIVKKSAIKQPTNEPKPTKSAKDDSEVTTGINDINEWIIDFHLNDKCIDIKYFGKFNKEKMTKFIKEEIWNKLKLGQKQEKFENYYLEFKDIRMEMK